MAVLQMLPEVIGAVELLRVVAFAELMHGSQMLEPLVPIWPRKVRKYFAAIATCVVGWSGACL